MPGADTSLPTHELPRSIEASPQLSLGLYNLTLQHRVLDNILTVLRPHPRKPDTLRRLAIPLLFLRPIHIQNHVLPLGILNLQILERLLCTLITLFSMGSPLYSGRRPVDDNVRGKLVASDVAYEVNAHTARSLVVQIAMQAQRPQVSLKFLE